MNEYVTGAFIAPVAFYGFGVPVQESRHDVETANRRRITAGEVVRSVVTATSSSRFVVPNYWADPTTGIGFQIHVEIPSAKMASLEDIGNIPIAHKGTSQMLLRNLATVTNGSALGEIDRYNMQQRMLTIGANVVGKLWEGLP